MSWLTDLLDVYGRVLRRAVDLTLKHWWLGLIAIAYLGAFGALLIVAMPFGLVGGFLLGFGMAALISSWLVLVGQVVQNGRVTLAEIPGSFVVYLFDVITFLFVRSLLSWAANIAFGDDSYAGIVADLALFVFLNAAPEQIYLARNSGLAVFVESYRFIGTYWIEWLPINVLLAVLFRAVIDVPVIGVALVLAAIVLTFGFIARGLLFLQLTTSSRRAREFARRTAG